MSEDGNRTNTGRPVLTGWGARPAAPATSAGPSLPAELSKAFKGIVAAADVLGVGAARMALDAMGMAERKATDLTMGSTPKARL